MTTTRTYQNATFTTAADYRHVMSKSFKPVINMTPCEKINLRNNLAYCASPVTDKLYLIHKDSAHYK